MLAARENGSTGGFADSEPAATCGRLKPATPDGCAPGAGCASACGRLKPPGVDAAGAMVAVGGRVKLPSDCWF
jgi:hypothetical protein